MADFRHSASSATDHAHWPLAPEVARDGDSRCFLGGKLRHTFATTALQKGISLPTVQKILGHDSLQTTAIYFNFTNVNIQDEFERKW